MAFDEGGENKQLGVLLAGYLEKQNPYGKVFRKRFVVLTQEAFHWFKVEFSLDLLVSLSFEIERRKGPPLWRRERSSFIESY
jgi:hypothetical protein